MDGVIHRVLIASVAETARNAGIEEKRDEVLLAR